MTALRCAMLAAFCLAMASEVRGQSPALPIEFVDGTQDNVGQRLAYLLKEEFRKSSAFSLVSDGPRWVVRLTSIAKDQDNPSIATVYSVVWLARGTIPCAQTAEAYLESTVGYVGSQKVQDVAQQLAGRTDRMITEIRQAAKPSP